MALTKIPASLLDTSSGINGLIYPTSDGTSGQFLKTDGSSNLTFATITTYTDSDVETYLDGGSSTPTFASATVSGTLTVTGDLDITGDINSYNVTDLDVTDKTITLGAGQTEANSGDSGIIIDGSNASILWDETNDKFDLSHGLHIGDSTAIGDATTPALQIGGTTTYRLGMYTTAEGAIIDNANGDDGIIFHTKNASEAMRIDSSGRLGVGCTPTGFTAEIQATSGGNALKLRGRNAAENAGWLAWTDYAGNVEAAMYATADNLIFANTTSYTERMRIDASGNVGIGTTSPDHLLEIETTSSSVAPKLGFRNTQAGAQIGMPANTNALSFTTADTERMRIDSSGNVGIGETNPTKLGLTGSSNGKVLALGGDDCQLRLTYTVLHHDHSGNTTTHLRNHYGSLDSLARMKLESGYISFHTGTAFTERMRVDSNGVVNIGATTLFSGNTKLEVQYGLTVKHSTTIGQGRNIYMDDNSGTLKFYSGYNLASLSSAGAWTNASDIAYKENIVDTEHGLDVVKLLQPRDYTLKSDSSSQTGFIAQELETHLPQFVDGNEGEKGVNYGQLTAVLTKAIQEQQTIIEDLKSRIETLEG